MQEEFLQIRKLKNTDDFSFIQFLSLKQQYQLLKEPLDQSILIAMIPYFNTEVQSFFFQKDKRANQVFQYFNVVHLSRNGVLFSREIIQNPIFFELLKRESLIDFRINLNYVLCSNPSFYLLEETKHYYDQLIDYYMESSDMFSCYYDYLETLRKTGKKENITKSYFFCDDIIYQINQYIEYDFLHQNFFFSDIQEIWNFFVKETGIRLSEIIVDALFQDHIYNVWLNIKEMLRYHKSLKPETRILDEEKISFYEKVLQIDQLSNKDKVRFYQQFKDKNIAFMFYHDLRNMKNLSYQNIKKDMIKLREHPDFLDKSLSEKYGIPIYDLRNQEYIMLASCLWKYQDRSCYKRNCYTLLSNENTNLFMENIFKYGYEDIEEDCVFHVFERDSASDDVTNKQIQEFGPQKINRIMTSKQVILSCDSHSEIQIVNKKRHDSMYDVFQPSFLISLERISEEEILEARRLQIPIAIISETNLLKGTKEQITYEEVIDDYITHPNFNELIKRRRRNR